MEQMRKEIQLLAGGLISDATAEMHTPHGSQKPQLHGLPKLHKPGDPFPLW